jgi:hypothetical protein
VDHRADLFSLGSVLYAMCTGRPPFRGETSVATLHCVSERQPRPIEEENPDMPEWLAKIIAKLHEKDSSKRYQSATEVEEELGRRLASLQQAFVARGRGSSWDAEVSVSQYPTHKPRTRRAKAAVLAAVLLLVVSLGFTEATGVTAMAHFLATVFQIETPLGTVIVDVDDPQATVTLDGDVIAIGADGFKELRLKPGFYEFGVTRDGVLGRPHKVSVKRDSKEILRIGFEQRQRERVDRSQSDAVGQDQKANERTEVLRQRLKVLQEQYDAGTLSLEGLLQESNDLLEAELEVTTSADARLGILEKQLANSLALEAATKMLSDDGGCSLEDTLAAKADRVEAENRLNRERSDRRAAGLRPENRIAADSLGIDSFARWLTAAQQASPNEFEHLVRQVIESRKAIQRGRVEYRQGTSGPNANSITRYTVWFDGESRRVDWQPLGGEVYTHIVTPRQFVRRHGGKPAEIFGPLRSDAGIPDPLRFGLVCWWAESATQFDYEQHLLRPNCRDVQISLGSIDNEPVWQVRYQITPQNRDVKNARPGCVEYALAVRKGSLPVRYVSRSTDENDTQYVMSFHCDLATFQSGDVWFPERIVFQYQRGDDVQEQVLTVKEAHFDDPIDADVFVGADLFE